MNFKRCLCWLCDGEVFADGEELAGHLGDSHEPWELAAFASFYMEQKNPPGDISLVRRVADHIRRDEAEWRT